MPKLPPPLHVKKLNNIMTDELQEGNRANNNKFSFPHKIDISAIKLSPQTQSRVGINQEKLAEYVQAWEDDVDFAPIDVFFDSESYWLADGWHRVLAAKQVGIQKILARIHQGTLRDAILWSCGANADHGLPRSNEDKRKAVLTLLQDPEWSQWSNREIAARAKVHHGTVASIRSSLGGEKPTEVKAKRNGKEYTHKVKEASEPVTVKEEQKQVAASLGVPASGLPSVKRNDGIGQNEEMFPAAYVPGDIAIALTAMPEEDLELTFRRADHKLSDKQIKAIHRAIAHRLIWEDDVA